MSLFNALLRQTHSDSASAGAASVTERYAASVAGLAAPPAGPAAPPARPALLVVTSEAMLAGTIAFLPIGLISLSGFHPERISLPAWSGLLYLALLTSALNYVIWFWGLEHLKPTTVAIMTNLQPVFTVAMAWLFLKEPLPAGFVLSTALVLGGVWLTQSESLRAANSVARAGAPTR